MSKFDELNEALDQLARFEKSLCHANLLNHAAVVQAVSSVILRYFQLIVVQADNSESTLTCNRT